MQTNLSEKESKFASEQKEAVRKEELARLVEQAVQDEEKVCEPGMRREARID
jgi:hypothetical protein